MLLDTSFVNDSLYPVFSGLQQNMQDNLNTISDLHEYLDKVTTQVKSEVRSIKAVNTDIKRMLKSLVTFSKQYNEAELKQKNVMGLSVPKPTSPTSLQGDDTDFIVPPMALLESQIIEPQPQSQQIFQPEPTPELQPEPQPESVPLQPEPTPHIPPTPEIVPDFFVPPVNRNKQTNISTVDVRFYSEVQDEMKVTFKELKELAKMAEDILVREENIPLLNVPYVNPKNTFYSSVPLTVMKEAGEFIPDDDDFSLGNNGSLSLDLSDDDLAKLTIGMCNPIDCSPSELLEIYQKKEPAYYKSVFDRQRLAAFSSAKTAVQTVWEYFDAEELPPRTASFMKVKTLLFSDFQAHWDILQRKPEPVIVEQFLYHTYKRFYTEALVEHRLSMGIPSRTMKWSTIPIKQH
jgi:hypothetical protein